MKINYFKINCFKINYFKINYFIDILAAIILMHGAWRVKEFSNGPPWEHCSCPST